MSKQSEDRNQGRYVEIAWRRRGSQSKRGKWSKTWEVMNSHFALWFLSAVLLSSLSWLYARWTMEAAESRRQLTTVARLDQEIMHRMSYGSSVAIQVQSFNTPRSEAKPVHLRNGSVLLNRIFGIPEPEFVLYPEYKDRTLESLIRELGTYLKEPQRQCVLWAAHEVWELSLTFRGIERLDEVATGLQSNLAGIARLRWGMMALWGLPITGKNEIPAKCGPEKAVF